MTLEADLFSRSHSKCELCSSESDLSIYLLPPDLEEQEDSSIVICAQCHEQLKTSEPNPHYWRCLNETMWTEVTPVKVVIWRILKKISDQPWAQTLFEQMYLDDDLLDWAQSESSGDSSSTVVQTKDSNGSILSDGDSVTLIKDLEVKGANFTAKRGTLVKNISLTGDPENVEGRVNGTVIVLKTKFLKKA